jgi:uncharacterized membrane protein
MPQARAQGNRQLGWRFPLFLAVLIVGLPVALGRLGVERGVLAAFDVAATVLLLACSLLFFSRSEDMRAAATANDAGRLLRLVIGIILALCVFAAMTALIADRAILSGYDRLLIAASLVLVWAFANTMYALHYAHLFYSTDADGRDQGGIAFPDTPEPLMADFAYFAFTIGVALQTADVSIGSRRIRRVVTGHEIVSFFFNVGVLALAVSVLGAA